MEFIYKNKAQKSMPVAFITADGDLRFRKSGYLPSEEGSTISISPLGVAFNDSYEIFEEEYKKEDVRKLFYPRDEITIKF